MLINEMRKSHEAYKQFIKQRDNGYWESHPIQEWYGRTYVVTGNVKLTTELQRLEVIDITSVSNPIARFANTWPEQSERKFALVHHSDEGQDLILYESGYKSWVTYADLPIRVIPGTKQDAQSVAHKLMDELEASVDAGGSIGL